MKISNSIFKISISTVCLSMPMLNSCSLMVAIGKEDAELSDQNPDTDPNADTLVGTARPKHPLLKYQDERADRQVKVPWAEKSLKARDAQALISTGSYHSCAQNSAGELKCWGVRFSGADGKDISNTDKKNYFTTYTNSIKKVAVAAGATCVVNQNYAPLCHGANYLIGTGTEEDSFKGVTPTGFTNARDLDGRGYNFCAIPSDGSLKCWGINFGKTTNEVAGSLKNLLRVEVGVNHHCIIDADFKALCWGSNTKGQLGLDIEKTTNRSSPVFVENLSQGVIHLAVGEEHTCALLESGSVRCWGSNVKGQLGNDSNTDSRIPVQVSGLESDVLAIDAGDAHTCALKVDGTVYCWGNNENGELGNGNNNAQKVPTKVAGLPTGAIQLSSGPKYNCILNTAKEAWCWGQNGNYSLLGDGESNDSNVPVQVKNFVPE